jgi:hypothetical protein
MAQNVHNVADYGDICGVDPVHGAVLNSDPLVHNV